MVVVAVRPSQIIEQLRERDGGLRATAQSRGVVSVLLTGPQREVSDVRKLARIRLSSCCMLPERVEK